MAGQQLAKDEAGHVWEVDANGQPIRLHTQAPAQGGVFNLQSPRQRLEAPLAQADLDAKRQEAKIRALQIDKMSREAAQGSGELPPPPGDPAKSGADYLASLPRGLAPTVQAVLDGRQAPPTSFALSKPYWQQIMSAANQIDPTFDQSQWAARVQVRKNYESQARGTPSGVINSLNTLAAHANSMYKNHLQMAGPNVGPLSGPVAGVMQSFDQHNTPAYNTEIRFVQGELQKLVNQGAATVSEAEALVHNLRAAQSFEARGEAIKAVVGLAEGKIAPIRQGWSAVMGDRPLPTDVTPSSMAVFDNILADGKEALPVDRYGTPIVPHSGTPGGGAGTLPGSPPSSPPVATLGPRPGSPLGPDRSTNPNSLRPDAGAGEGPGNTSLEKGSSGRFSTVQDRAYQAALQGAFNKGASRDQIQSLATKFGYPPLGPDLDAAISYRDKGGHGAAIELPKSGNRDLSFGEQFNNWAADSDVGTGVIHGGLSVGALPNGATRLAGRALGFNGDMREAFGSSDQNDAVMSYLDSQHRKSAITGDLIGGVAGAGGLEALAAKGLLKAGVGEGARSVAAPLVGDTAFGALQGAGNAQQGSELQGGLIGALAGGAGGTVGRKVIGPAVARALQPLAASRPMVAAGNRARGMFGAAPIVPPEAPTVAQQQLLRAATPDMVSQLDEAAMLRVPMSLADTAPAMTALGGAVIRRSPTARQVAEDAFLPRSRGQIDRFGNAVARDLGPVADIPQTSANLTEQARTAAAPLYEQAYAAPGASSVNLDDLLPRPSMRAGMSRAYRIAQEEGRDPTALGFNLNHAGEVELARVPSFQTLDYIKRGVDDALEPHRNPLTGRLALNEDTRAINSTRASLLNRVDAANPSYAAARAAYAGPTQARDALSRGADAFGLSPDELRFQVGQQTPEHIGQMQLGFRSEMMNRANNVRDTSNPFESVLGSPAARSRIDALHPGNNENLFRTRDLELQLARSQNSILGNSLTAERSLADKAMAAAPGMLPAGLADMGLMGLHAPPIATLGYLAAKGVKAGIQRATDRRIASVADQLAPTLFNTNPAQASASLSDLMNSSQSYRDFVLGQRRKIANGSGMFGAGAGAAGASLLEH